MIFQRSFFEKLEAFTFVLYDQIKCGKSNINGV